MLVIRRREHCGAIDCEELGWELRTLLLITKSDSAVSKQSDYQIQSRSSRDKPSLSAPPLSVADRSACRQL